MAKRRHNADTAAPAAQTRGGSPSARPRARAHRSWGEALLALARLGAPAAVSALVLSLAFPRPEVSWLAYVALVPLVIGVVRARSAGDASAGAMAGGLVFFGINLFWMVPITVAGYAAALPYMAAYWGLFGWAVWRIVRMWRVPLTLLAPVAWVALEWVRGWMITGFPWIYVGHTQYENLALIQTADLAGAWAASFLCLMTTGLAADLLTHPLIVRPPAAPPPGRANRRLIGMIILTAAAWAFTVGYGVWRLEQPTQRPGPVVASVQTCVPQDVKRIIKIGQIQTEEDYRRAIEEIEQTEVAMLDEQVRLTGEAVADARASGLSPDLVVWPETMVPGIVNPSFLNYDPGVLAAYPALARSQERSRGYWRRIQQTAREAGAPVLFGGHSNDLRQGYAGRMEFVNKRNAAIMVGPQTPLYGAENEYAKHHLVVFGEYVPFKQSWPWLNNVLQMFTPYDYDYSLTPGAADQPPFAVGFGDGRTARFQVAICYEDAMPYRVRQMVRPTADAPGRKAVDFIANISNDGWFNGSVELDQHLNLCVFRAIENRVAVVRSVNTGISAIITPTGGITAVVETGGSRRNVCGQIVGPLVLDDRLAPYTLAGDWLAWACAAAAAAGVAAAVVRRRLLMRERREEAAT